MICPSKPSRERVKVSHVIVVATRCLPFCACKVCALAYRLVAVSKLVAALACALKGNATCIKIVECRVSNHHPNSSVCLIFIKYQLKCQIIINTVYFLLINICIINKFNSENRRLRGLMP